MQSVAAHRMLGLFYNRYAHKYVPYQMFKSKSNTHLLLLEIDFSFQNKYFCTE